MHVQVSFAKLYAPFSVVPRRRHHFFFPVPLLVQLFGCRFPRKMPSNAELAKRLDALEAKLQNESSKLTDDILGKYFGKALVFWSWCCQAKETVLWS